MEYLVAIVAYKIATEIWPNFGMVCVSGCS